MSENLVGLSSLQSPKYTVNDHAIIDRKTNKEIPFTEPVFILRASDSSAICALQKYHAFHIQVGNYALAATILEQIKAFNQFATTYGSQMRFPIEP
jgi:hypothetical protein